MKIKPQNEIQLYFYRKTDYDNAADAEEDGALYEVSTATTFAGATGMYDLLDIIDAADECIGGNNHLTAAVLIDGTYIDFIDENIADD